MGGTFCWCLSTIADLTLEGLPFTIGERWLGLAGRAGRAAAELELVLLGSLGRAGEVLGLLWGDEEKPLLLPELVGFVAGLTTAFSTELDLEGDLE